MLSVVGTSVAEPIFCALLKISITLIECKEFDGAADDVQCFSPFFKSIKDSQSNMPEFKAAFTLAKCTASGSFTRQCGFVLSLQV